MFYDFMNEKFNTNVKVDRLTKMFKAVGKKKALSLNILQCLTLRVTIFNDDGQTVV